MSIVSKFFPYVMTKVESNIITLCSIQGESKTISFHETVFETLVLQEISDNFLRLLIGYAKDVIDFALH